MRRPWSTGGYCAKNNYKRKAGFRNGRIEAEDKNGWRRIAKRPRPT